MTTKADYTADEWGALMMTPLMTGTFIMAADKNLMGVVTEMAKLMEAVKDADAPEPARTLAQAVGGDVAAMTKDKGLRKEFEAREKAATPPPAGTDPATFMLERVTDGLAVIEAKGGRAERDAFATWLLSLARVVAEASSEGGIFGIGGDVAVSDKETAALDQLRQAMGIATASETSPGS